MSDDRFEASWLELREPVDHAARAEDLVAAVAQEGLRRGWTNALDLGTGTGSNLRYLAPRLPWVERWTLVDHDTQLLGRVSDLADAEVLRVEGDLAREGLDRVAEADLVTASALLDLVSETWLSQLAAACDECGAGVLVALSYDGSIRWSTPDGSEDDYDELMVDAMNAHQRRTKGLGQALGPDACATAERLFAQRGFRTTVRPSPWILEGATHAALAAAFVAGWAEAALEMHPSAGPRIAAWKSRKFTAIRKGAFQLRVGHQDILAIPPESKPRRDDEG